MERRHQESYNKDKSKGKGLKVYDTVNEAIENGIYNYLMTSHIVRGALVFIGIAIAIQIAFILRYKKEKRGVN